MTEIAAIILAAGRATRFGASATTSKVLALLDDIPLVLHAVRAAHASSVGDVVVVTGHAATQVERCLLDSGARIVFNPDFAKGMATSLKAGVAALSPDTEAAVVLLADMPRVTPAIIDRLVETFAAGARKSDAVVPVTGGKRGNPVLLGRSMFPEVAALIGDQGARRLLEDPRWSVSTCEVDDAAVTSDIDTPEALAALQKRESLKPPP